VRSLAGQRLEEDRAEAIDIAAFVDAVACACLLGRHVGGSAGATLGRLAALAAAKGEAPVHDLHFAVAADHDVVGFEVAVHDALGVHEGDRLTGLEDDLQQLRLGAVLGVQDLGEAAPFDEFHREVGAAVVEGAGLVDGHHAGMRQLAAEARFFAQMLDQVGVAEMGRAKDLESEAAAEIAVLDAIDVADSAAAEMLEHLVAWVLGRELGRITKARHDRLLEVLVQRREGGLEEAFEVAVVVVAVVLVAHRGVSSGGLKTEGSVDWLCQGLLCRKP
jgi:hypothetical protein